MKGGPAISTTPFYSFPSQSCLLQQEVRGLEKSPRNSPAGSLDDYQTILRIENFTEDQKNMLLRFPTTRLIYITKKTQRIVRFSSVDIFITRPLIPLGPSLLFSSHCFFRLRLSLLTPPEIRAEKNAAEIKTR